jgi:hypothetical protein
VRQLRAATNTGFGGGGDPPDPPDPEKIAKALKHAEARARVWPDPGAGDAAAGEAAGDAAAAGDDADDAAILAAAGHGGQAFPPLPAGNAGHVFLPDWTHGRIAGMHMNLIEGIVGIYSDKTEWTLNWGSLPQNWRDMNFENWIEKYWNLVFSVFTFPISFENVF